MAATTNIAQIKTNNNEDFFDTKRYEEILAQVRKAVTNTVYEEAIIETFKDMMAHVQRMQKNQLGE
ncbi:MAG: chorismate mutase [Tetragenococcus koreensis]|nr:chorismate mutase [Tetragenococcus koreensis]